LEGPSDIQREPDISNGSSKSKRLAFNLNSISGMDPAHIQLGPDAPTNRAYGFKSGSSRGEGHLAVKDQDVKREISVGETVQITGTEQSAPDKIV
jgi:hypothetical protein